MALGAASPFAEARLDEQLGEERWIMPALDADVIALDGDPAEVTAVRESVRLAFVAALQRPGPRWPTAGGSRSTRDPAHHELLARYVDAFARDDIPLLVTLLRDDVVLSMPPWNLWLQGTDDLAAWFLGPGHGCRGSKLVSPEVSGTAGFGSYRLTRPGLWEPFAVQVVEVAGGQVVGHHNFLFPERFADYGLPPRIEA